MNCVQTLPQLPWSRALNANGLLCVCSQQASGHLQLHGGTGCALMKWEEVAFYSTIVMRAAV